MFWKYDIIQASSLITCSRHPFMANQRLSGTLFIYSKTTHFLLDICFGLKPPCKAFYLLAKLVLWTTSCPIWLEVTDRDLWEDRITLYTEVVKCKLLCSMAKYVLCPVYSDPPIMWIKYRSVDTTPTPACFPMSKVIRYKKIHDQKLSPGKNTFPPSHTGNYYV